MTARLKLRTVTHINSDDHRTVVVVVVVVVVVFATSKSIHSFTGAKYDKFLGAVIKR